MKFKIIEEANTMLIPLEQKHAQNILDANYDNVRKYCIPFDSLEEVKNWIQGTLTETELDKKIEIAIFDESKFAGIIGIDNLLEEHVDMKLWIQPDQQQKGIAKKAFVLLTEWLKVSYPSKDIIYKTEADNSPSIKLAESLGFVLVRDFVDIDGTENLEYRLEFRA